MPRSDPAERRGEPRARRSTPDRGRCRAGQPLVRLWDPPEYAVVLGASRRIADDVFLEACRADGVPILRRSSGGGTVVVGPGVLCVTVILPEDAAPGLSARRPGARSRARADRRSHPQRRAVRQRARPRRPGAGRPQIRRQRPAPAQELVHGALLDPLRFPDRAHRPIPQNARAASPNIVPVDPTKTSWSTWRCLVTSSRMRSGTHFLPASDALRRRLCRRRSSNPSCPRNSRIGSGSSGSEASEL